jgi:ABC-2 type transport system ATP-binding protein
MIEIKQLDKVYGNGSKAVNALNGIKLHIEAGMFGLLGPNGAGKTTLMRILAGIVAPSRGSVQVDGYNLSTDRGKEAVKALLGYLPQELGLYPDLNGKLTRCWSL